MVLLKVLTDDLLENPEGKLTKCNFLGPVTGALKLLGVEWGVGGVLCVPQYTFPCSRTPVQDPSLPPVGGNPHKMFSRATGVSFNLPIYLPVYLPPSL